MPLLALQACLVAGLLLFVVSYALFGIVLLYLVEWSQGQGLDDADEQQAKAAWIARVLSAIRISNFLLVLCAIVPFSGVAYAASQEHKSLWPAIWLGLDCVLWVLSLLPGVDAIRKYGNQAPYKATGLVMLPTVPMGLGMLLLWG